MSQVKTKDLTTGKPMKLIIEFAVPLLFGFLFQQFYNLVDTIIVGQFLGVGALAAVGATGSINFMIIGFCMGVCNGFAIPMAHKFGAGDYAGLRKVVANSVWLSAIFAVVMTSLVSIFCRPILELMRTPEDIIDWSYQYILIIFLGIPVTYLYNLVSGIIRSMGDSKTPVIFLTMSSVMNIALDLICIRVFHMGVAGAAVATVISQAVSGIACLLYMRGRYEALNMEKEDWKWNGHMAANLCGMGIPMGLQYSITAIGGVILQTSVNALGSAVVAAMTAASKVGMFFCCPFDALGSTMATYGGQNVGAKRLDRVGEGLKSCILLGLVYSVLALVFFIFFGEQLAAIFVNNKETEIIANVCLFLQINGAFYFPLALVNIIRFLIQGMGFSKFAILAGVCEMAARTLVAFALVPIFGFVGACFASPVAWLAADAFLIPAYLSVRKRLEVMFSSK